MALTRTFFGSEKRHVKKQINIGFNGVNQLKLKKKARVMFFVETHVNFWTRFSLFHAFLPHGKKVRVTWP